MVATSQPVRPTRRIPRGVVFVGGGCALILLLLQVPPVARTNPPVESEITAPPAVTGVLRRACYDCHSNETKWPWYGYVAPVSWVLADHVAGGRAEVNFSAWDRYTPAQQAELRHEIWEQVAEARMPLPGYLLLHADARLAGADQDAIRAWANDLPRRDNASIEAGSVHHRDDADDEDDEDDEDGADDED